MLGSPETRTWERAPNFTGNVATPHTRGSCERAPPGVSPSPRPRGLTLSKHRARGSGPGPLQLRALSARPGAPAQDVFTMGFEAISPALGSRLSGFPLHNPCGSRRPPRNDVQISHGSRVWVGRASENVVAYPGFIQIPLVGQSHMISLSRETFLGFSPASNTNWAANQGVQRHTQFLKHQDRRPTYSLEPQKWLGWLVPSSEIGVSSLSSRHDDCWSQRKCHTQAGQQLRASPRSGTQSFPAPTTNRYRLSHVALCRF